MDRGGNLDGWQSIPYGPNSGWWFGLLGASPFLPQASKMTPALALHGPSRTCTAAALANEKGADSSGPAPAAPPVGWD